MRLHSRRLALAVGVALAWLAACGGETGKRGLRQSSAAGEAGAGEASGDGARLDAGGSADTGTPSSERAGVGGVPASGGALASGGVPASGGVGVNSAGEGGRAGGAGGIGESGAAGEGGAPPRCCQPLTCADVIPGLDCGLNAFRDGCGSAFFCGCPDGDECSQNECIVCDPGADPCAADTDLCGPTTDRCGNVITCPDQCTSLLGPLGTCDDGRCCELTKTTCAADDCGFMSDGCGGFVDCTANACDAGTCQLDGKCCTPSVTCLPGDCGAKLDGCGNYLDCGDPCVGDQLCMENHCHDSVCKLGGFECETAYNAAVDGYEYCGSCGPGEGCLDHHCLPLCSAAP